MSNFSALSLSSNIKTLDLKLTQIMENQNVTEIIFQGYNSIWFEDENGFQPLDFEFSENNYTQFFHKVLDESHLALSIEKPCGDSKWNSFRVHAITPPLVPHLCLTLRRQKTSSWTLNDLAGRRWAEVEQINFLKMEIEKHSNILVIGATGSGKTSVTEALLHEIPMNERCVIIEESEELHLPNSASIRLLTRSDSQNLLPEITATELIRQALRMRPHRLLMGEIRGGEAKDFLLTLSTGHQGSLATLHAHSASQALIRLEMLIQLGAPQWSLDSIRKLLGLSLDIIISVGPDKFGIRKLKSISKVCGIEDSGLLLDLIFELEE